jgi:hypothetical protein
MDGGEVNFAPRELGYGFTGALIIFRQFAAGTLPAIGPSRTFRSARACRIPVRNKQYRSLGGFGRQLYHLHNRASLTSAASTVRRIREPAPAGSA